jgi:hypothetical protein
MISAFAPSLSFSQRSDGPFYLLPLMASQEDGAGEGNMELCVLSVGRCNCMQGGHVRFRDCNGLIHEFAQCSMLVFVCCEGYGNINVGCPLPLDVGHTTCAALVQSGVVHGHSWYECGRESG